MKFTLCKWLVHGDSFCVSVSDRSALQSLIRRLHPKFHCARQHVSGESQAAVFILFCTKPQRGAGMGTFFIFFLFFLLIVVLRLNSGPCTCEADALKLSCTLRCNFASLNVICPWPIRLPLLPPVKKTNKKPV